MEFLSVTDLSFSFEGRTQSLNDVHVIVLSDRGRSK